MAVQLYDPYQGHQNQLQPVQQTVLQYAMPVVIGMALPTVARLAGNLILWWYSEPPLKQDPEVDFAREEPREDRQFHQWNRPCCDPCDCSHHAETSEESLTLKIVDLFGITSWINYRQAAFEAVFDAARRGNWQKLAPLEGELSQVMSHTGDSLLMEAVQRGDENFVKVLIQRGLIRGATDLIAALNIAVENGLLEAAESIWESLYPGLAGSIKDLDNPGFALKFLTKRMPPDLSQDFLTELDDPGLLVNLYRSSPFNIPGINVQNNKVLEVELTKLVSDPNNADVAQALVRSISNKWQALRLLKRSRNSDLALALFEDFDSHDLAMRLCQIGERWLVEEKNVPMSAKYFRQGFDMLRRMHPKKTEAHEDAFSISPRGKTGALLSRARAYAILRSANPDDADIVDLFAKACVHLGSRDSGRALVLVKSSIKEQEKLCKCVFPSVVKGGEAILNAGQKEQSAMGEFFRSIDACYWGVESVRFGLEFATLFYLVPGKDLVDGAETVGKKIASWRNQKWIEWGEKYAEEMGETIDTVTRGANLLESTTGGSIAEFFKYNLFDSAKEKCYDMQGKLNTKKICGSP